MSEEPIDELLVSPEPTEEEKERDLRIAKRRELLDHIDLLIRPPAQFYNELETGIELAAEGRIDEEIEIGRELRKVSDVVRDWELEDLVERAKAGTWGEAGADWW
jgi:hypothetical protein